MATRVEERVEISWTVPSAITDGGSLRLPITAVLCRDEPANPPPGNKAASCTAVQHLVTTPGPVHLTDPLPASLTSGNARLLAYRVELFNPQGHSAGLSAPAYAAAGRAPAPAGGIAVVPRRNSSLITWQPIQPEVGAEEQMEITRTLAGAGTAPHKETLSTQPALGKTASRAVLTPARTIHADPGGTIDHGIHDGDNLIYTAQRVRRVELDVPASSAAGKDGTPREIKPSRQLFALRGQPSPPVAFAFHDTLPPGAPTGLIAVPGGGFGQPPSIDLSWELNPEEDTLGYNLYRAIAAATPHFGRLNPDLIPGPAFRDTTPQAGVRYLYQVTAVDKRHNESAPSQPIVAELPR